MNGSAIISDDAVHRFELWRTWDDTKPRMTFVMLNPSTADAVKSDATITRCIGFAMREGLRGNRRREPVQQARHSPGPPLRG